MEARSRDCYCAKTLCSSSQSPGTRRWTTQASDDQVESKESKITDHDKKEYLAQHVILSTTSTWLGIKLKSLKTTKEMWDIVKTDATLKSTLYILDTEDQLSSMKLEDNEDPATHLSELKQHFQLMLQ